MKRFVLVITTLLVCFCVNVYRLVTAYQHGAAQKPTAVERVDSAMQSVGHHVVLKVTK